MNLFSEIDVPSHSKRVYLLIQWYIFGLDYNFISRLSSTFYPWQPWNINTLWNWWCHYEKKIFGVERLHRWWQFRLKNINGNIDQICPDGAIFMQSNQHWRQFIGHEDFCNQNIYLGTFTCWMSVWSVLLISKHLSPSWVNAEQWADRSSRSVESLESDTISGATWD